MNIFERDAEDKNGQTRANGMISTWVCFVKAAETLLDDYNHKHPKGNRYPAEIKQKTENSLVVECALGQSEKDPFSRTMVTATARMEQPKLTINCSIQRWRRGLPQTPPSMESTKNMQFVLDEDNVSLDIDGEKIAPFTAAEKLLAAALL